MIVTHADLRLDDRAALVRELGEGTDDELLLRGHARWGGSFPTRLVGDFAYAIREGDRLLLARDAFGVKPLFYSVTPAGVLVTGDPSGLPGRTPDAATIRDYLEGYARDSRRTFFEEVRRVPPGHVVVVTPAGAREERWFHPPATARLSPGECARELRRLLERAVASRLASPALVHASGGLDSSSIACLADRLGGDVRLVAARFPGLDCDETPFQDAVARRASRPFEAWDGTAPTEPGPPLAWHPFRVAPPDNNAGCYAIARRVGARVVLSGRGGDELLFEQDVFRDLAARGRLLALAREASLAPRTSTRARGAILRDAFVALVPERVRRLRRRPVAPPPWAGPRLRAEWEPARPERGEGESHVQRGTWRWLMGPSLVQKLELEGALARREGIELRYPFLDVRLARFVLALPPERRLPGGRMKRLLRMALADVLPPEVRDREHVTGFESLMLLQARTTHAHVRTVLNEGEWASEPFVDRGYVRAMPVRDAFDARFLWDVACVEEWLRAVAREASRCRGALPSSRGGPGGSRSA